MGRLLTHVSLFWLLAFGCGRAEFNVHVNDEIIDALTSLEYGISFNQVFFQSRDPIAFRFDETLLAAGESYSLVNLVSESEFISPQPIPQEEAVPLTLLDKKAITLTVVPTEQNLLEKFRFGTENLFELRVFDANGEMKSARKGVTVHDFPVVGVNSVGLAKDGDSTSTVSNDNLRLEIWVSEFANARARSSDGNNEVTLGTMNMMNPLPGLK